MACIADRLHIAGTKNDKRVKISPEMREQILEEEGVLSQRVTARKYGISRKMVIYIWYPERLEHAKKLFAERQKDGRYYDRRKHNEAVKDLRKRKMEMYKKGELKD